MPSGSMVCCLNTDGPSSISKPQSDVSGFVLIITEICQLTVYHGSKIYFNYTEISIHTTMLFKTTNSFQFVYICDVPHSWDKRPFETQQKHSSLMVSRGLAGPCLPPWCPPFPDPSLVGTRTNICHTSPSLTHISHGNVPLWKRQTNI